MSNLAGPNNGQTGRIPGLHADPDAHKSPSWQTVSPARKPGLVSTPNKSLSPGGRGASPGDEHRSAPFGRSNVRHAGDPPKLQAAEQHESYQGEWNNLQQYGPPEIAYIGDTPTLAWQGDGGKWYDFGGQYAFVPYGASAKGKGGKGSGGGWQGGKGKGKGAWDRGPAKP